MTLENKIKSTLVHFFREGTNKDYLVALNNATKEMMNHITPKSKCNITDRFMEEHMDDLAKFIEIRRNELEQAYTDDISYEE